MYPPSCVWRGRLVPMSGWGSDPARTAQSDPTRFTCSGRDPCTISPGKLLVRGNTERASADLSTVLARVDSNLRRTPLLPYTSHLAEWFAPLRLHLGMVGGLGIVGLVLASLGIYSLLAYR